MSIFSRFVFFCYNLVLIFLAGVAIAASTGNLELGGYLDTALATPESRALVGIAALLMIVLAVAMMLAILKRKAVPRPRAASFDVETTLNGSIRVTESALKVIIMRAIKQVDGVKEVNTRVENMEKGLHISVHMMINPNLSVVEMSQAIQASIKETVERISGLTVELVTVMADDFNASRAQGGGQNV